MRHMTIGQLAKRAGVGVEIVRFYQRRGLFPEPPRHGRGFREYPSECLDLLRFIRRARGLGFSLKEVEKLIALRRRGKEASEVTAMLAEKAGDVERKMRELAEVRTTLATIIERFEQSAPDVRWEVFDAEN